ncbi:Predicted membrane protein [Legionella wadsworthii]|uniref:Predicted membrane protein n=1 Tax=Legionella wadsworthii TaxID=28088 RepID=A0A378LS39_9GAMM|nr:DUF2243 domain-containing protein [Legionella wadsworthii]STY29180.1 Predicted membrane protein [Legionella wadsworthii]
MTNYKKYLIAAGLFLGIGLGGFIDGILFHQLLQIHNMLSNIFFPDTLVNIQINMFWDGLFHAFTFFTTLIGIFLLWITLNNSSEKYSILYFFGLLILGWGIFNFVEGIIDHLILRLHHVLQRSSHSNQLYSDIAFECFGVLLLIIGTIFIKTRRPNDK